MRAEGYMLAAWGDRRYIRHAVCCARTIRRHDSRPVALATPPGLRDSCEAEIPQGLFSVHVDIDPRHASIPGYKLHLHELAPFDRTLVLDSDMVWCREPSRLWASLRTYDFTATGTAWADPTFGPGRTWAAVTSLVMGARSQVLSSEGIRYLPRIQAGMILVADRALCQRVLSDAARMLLTHSGSTFSPRRSDRSDQTCEWALAMAMARADVPVMPWVQGGDSPQLDYVPGLVDHDPDFERVRCTLYTNPAVHAARSLHHRVLRNAALAVARALPTMGEHMIVTPYALHFGTMAHKRVYDELCGRLA